MISGRLIFVSALILALPLFSVGANAGCQGTATDFNCGAVPGPVSCSYINGCTGTTGPCGGVGLKNCPDILDTNTCNNWQGGGVCTWSGPPSGGGGMPSATATISGRIFYMHNNSPAGNVNLTAWSYPTSPYASQDILNSTLTDADGNYSLFVNTSTQFEPFRPFTMSAKIYGADGNATFVTPALPPAPPTNRNNVKLYLSPVVTVRVSPKFNGVAIGTGNYTNCTFDGVVMDQKVVIPYEFFRNKQVSYDIVLPQDRNYSIVLMTPPPTPGCAMGSPPKQINNAGGTNGLFTNTSAINASNLAQPTVRQLSPEMNFSMVAVTGFFRVNGTTPGDLIAPNITFQNPLIYIEIMNRDNYRFLPPDAIFPFKALNSSDLINGTTGEFRITLTSGSNYIIGGFANNNSNLSWGGYANFTGLTGNIEQNITLYPFTGKRYAGTAVTNPQPGPQFMNASDITTNQITINVTSDATGIAGSTAVMNAPLNLYITYPDGMKIQWLLTGGRGSGERAFSIPSGTGITLEAFNPGFAPIKFVFNSTQIQDYVLSNNSVLPVQMKRFDVRKPRRMPGNASEVMNLTSSVRMQFMKSNATCSIPNAGPECNIGDQEPDARSFNPLNMMMLGKTDILMTQTTGRGNITIKYVGASLMSTAPPDAQFMDEPIGQSSDGRRETWRFGSSAPQIYDYALVAMPYNSSRINENAPMRARIPLLYDQNGNAIYNMSSTTGMNVTPEDYSDYNQSWFTQAGITCTQTQTDLCYQDKATDTLWMKMMHFSEVGPESEGGVAGAPEINLTDYTAAFNNTWTNSPPMSFNFTAVDNDSLTMNCTLFINGAFNSTNTSVGNNTPTSLPLNGSYSNSLYNWTIACTDQYNYTGSTYLRTFTVDTIQPSIIISAPQGFTNSNILNFTAIDTTPTLSCNKTLNGATTSIGTVANGAPNTTTLTSINEGANSINVTCADLAGNVNTSATVTFNRDTTPPTIAIQSPASTTYGTTNISLNFTVTDSSPITGYKYELNGVNTSLSTGNGTVITGVEGANSVKVWANDTLNNWNVSGTVSFTVDLTKPVIIIASPAQGGIYNSIALNFTAYDNLAATLSCNRTVNGANLTTITVQNGTANVTTPSWAQGTNYVNVTCADSAGNSNTSATTSFTYDSIAPAISLIAPASGSNTSSASVLLNVSVVDALSSSLNCSIKIDGSSLWANATWPNGTNIQNLTTLAEGTHSVNATCTDLATNSNTTSTNSFTVDFSPPSITSANTTPSRAYNGTSVLISAVANDSKTSVVSVVANITRPSGTTYLLPLAGSGSVWSNITTVNEVGTYTAVLNATDAVGWTYARTLTFLSAANTTITYNITNSTGGATNISISILAPENDGTLNSSSSGNSTLSTPAGTVTIRIVDTNTKVTIDLPVNLTGAVSFSPIIQVENATAVVSAPTYNTPLLVQTITPNITIYANATLKFNYSGLGVSLSEAYRLRVNKCTTYNASANSCTGSWTELTSSIDNASQTVTANVSSFSTFMLANKTSICGNSVQETGEECDAGSSGSSSCTSSCTTITTTTPPSGGGYSGGSAPATTTTIKETQSISKVVPGVMQTIAFSKPELPVSQIKLESLAALTGVSISIEKLDSKPSTISADPTATGKAYKYLEISSTIPSANISKAKIKFKVETKWITSNNYSTSTVSLNRYSSKAWSKLSTVFLNADANNSYFESDSPGFSTFAITGEKYVPPPPAPVEQPKPPEPPKEEPTPIAPTPTALTPVVALITQSDIDAVSAGVDALTPQTDEARKLVEQAKIKVAGAQAAFNSNEQARAKQLIDEANLLMQEAAGLKSVAVSKGKTGIYVILLLAVILIVGAYAYYQRPQTKDASSRLAKLKEERQTILQMKKNAEKEYLSRKIDKAAYNSMLSGYESRLIEVNTRIENLEKKNN